MQLKDKSDIKRLLSMKTERFYIKSNCWVKTIDVKAVLDSGYDECSRELDEESMRIDGKKVEKEKYGWRIKLDDGWYIQVVGFCGSKRLFI